jgi:hypothetical protein
LFGQDHGNSHCGTVLSCVFFLFPKVTSVRHLDVLLLRNSLCSFQIALLCLFILNLCIFEFIHANNWCH